MIHDPRQFWLLPETAPEPNLGYRGFQVLRMIREHFAATGQPPSYTEIMRALDFADRADVCRVVARLEGKGLIHRVGKGRVRRIRLNTV